MKLSFARTRSLLLFTALSLVAMIAALPNAAQQVPPLDDARIRQIATALELTNAQADRLFEVYDARRTRIDDLQARLRQANADGGDATEAGRVRAELDRERRALADAVLPALRPEQQARFRAMLGVAPPTIGNSANAPAPASPVGSLKPQLPNSPLAAGERLIALPKESNQSRTRRATDAPDQLSEEQKILHLLNRAGFGPRPGDIERVRAMGIDRYLDAQLHPDTLNDELLARPLNALSTLQMTGPEIAQNFAPPPVRPTPTPHPVLNSDGATGRRGDGATEGEMMKASEMAGQGDKETRRQGDTGTMNTGVMTGQSPDRPVAQSLSRPVAEIPSRPVTQSPSRPVAVDTQRPLRELQQAKLLRAVFSERQLQEVMTDFWFNHFNVWANKDNARYLVTSYERDVIRPHALGRFKDLLLATAQSPAMLYYLDNFLSQMETPAPPVKYDADGNPLPPPRRPGLNENYGRELLELHTLGVDGGYTQKDVTEVARCFTGWTVAPMPNPLFVFRPRLHDKGEKFVLGQRIAPGGGIEDGLRVLDLLSKHPATARFIARKLCQRFVADEPPQALVERIARVFSETDGQIAEVVRAILTSPEFNSPRYYRNKIKSPLELAASALRATGATTDGASPLIQWVARMGEPLYLYQPPTGYDEKSEHWLSNATLLERMNFGVALASGKIAGTRFEVGRLIAPGAQGDRLLDQLIAVIIHSEISPETRKNLRRVIDDSHARVQPARYDDRKGTEQLLPGVAALVLGAREFQVK